MSRVEFRPAARLDLAEIGAYIGVRNPQRAESFVNEIVDQCHARAEFPYSGQAMTKLKGNYRFFPHGRYMIIYMPQPDGISVERVVHASRDLSKL